MAFLAVLALMLALMPLAVAVSINLRILGYHVTVLDGCYAYFMSQPGKYLPGKVWLFAVRGAIYSRYGIRPRIAAFSMALEVVLYVASALIIGMTMALFSDSWQFPFSSAWLVAFILGSLVLCSPPMLNYLLKRLCPETTGDTSNARVGFVHVASVLACYLFAWLSIGFAFLLLTRASAVAPPSSYSELTAAFAIACVAGYFVVLAPGGLGPRELVLTAALAPSVGPGHAATLALAARCWWTLAELGCVAVTMITYHWI